MNNTAKKYAQYALLTILWKYPEFIPMSRKTIKLCISNLFKSSEKNYLSHQTAHYTYEYIRKKFHDNIEY